MPGATTSRSVLLSLADNPTYRGRTLTYTILGAQFRGPIDSIEIVNSNLRITTEWGSTFQAPEDQRSRGFWRLFNDGEPLVQYLLDEYGTAQILRNGGVKIKITQPFNKLLTIDSPEVRKLTKPTT